VYSQRFSATAFILFAGLFILVFVPVSKADGVTYTFTGVNNSLNDDQLSVAFTFTAPGFLPSTAPGTFISLFASQLDSCTNCLVSNTVPAVDFSTQGLFFGDEVDFADKFNFGSVYEFPLGSFDIPGTYHSTAPFNEGTLIVGPLVTTPEPSALSLLLCGLLLLVIFYVRKRQLVTN